MWHKQTSLFLQNLACLPALALLQMGSTSVLVMFLAAIALFVSSINIFGGFWVTQRMLRMFRKDT